MVFLKEKVELLWKKEIIEDTEKGVRNWNCTGTRGESHLDSNREPLHVGVYYYIFWIQASHIDIDAHVSRTNNLQFYITYLHC